MSIQNFFVEKSKFNIIWNFKCDYFDNFIGFVDDHIDSGRFLGIS